MQTVISRKGFNKCLTKKTYNPSVFEFCISLPLSTDEEFIERLCNMGDLDRVRYMYTFTNGDRTLEDNVIVGLQKALKEKFTCVVTEAPLFDVCEINKRECTFVLDFMARIEYHYDESENIEPNQAYIDLKNTLIKGCPSNWMIN